MADMMATAAAWFESQRRSHLSVDAEYYKLGSVTPVDCVVTVVTGKWDAMNAAGQMVRVQTKDIFVPVADYSDEPQRGDRIVTGGGTYEVVVPPGMDQCWLWSDVANKLRRVHCMRIDDTRVAAAVFIGGVFVDGVYAS